MLAVYGGPTIHLPCTGEAPALDEAEALLRKHPKASLGLIHGVPLPQPENWGTSIEHWGLSKANGLTPQQREADRLRRFNNWWAGHQDLFNAPRRWGAGKDHISHHNAVPQECDGAASEEQQRSLPGLAGLPWPSAEVWTGGKSLHFWWRLLDGQHLTPAEFRAVAIAIEHRLNAAAAAAGIDTTADHSSATSSKPMRMPGWVHPKTRQPTVLLYDDGPRYSREQLLALVPPPQPKPRKPPRSTRPKGERVPGPCTYDGSPDDDPTWVSLLSRAEQRATAIEMLRQPGVPLRTVEGQSLYEKCLPILAGLVHHFGQAEAAAICREAGWCSPAWNPDEIAPTIHPRQLHRASLRRLIAASGIQPPAALEPYVASTPAGAGPVYSHPIEVPTDLPLPLALADAMDRSEDACPLVICPDPCGSGKTHAVPDLARIWQEARHPGCRIIYCSPGYRSPTVPALQGWALPFVRHYGLVAVEVNGVTVIRRRRKDEVRAGVPLIEPPSCRLSLRFDAWRAGGGSHEDADAICLSCRYQDGCPFWADRPGFNARWVTGKTTRTRCAVASLPGLKLLGGVIPWERTYIVIDEAVQLEAAASETITLPFDLMAVWADWLRNPPPLVGAVDGRIFTLLEALRTIPQVLAASERRHGLGVEEMRQRFGHLAAELEIPAGIDEQLQHPPQDLPPEDEPDFLPTAPLLLAAVVDALRGTAGAIRATPDKGLALTVPNNEVRQALEGCAGVVVLDGTTPTETIRRLVKGATPCRPEIVRTVAGHGLEGVRFVQIPDLGPMGSQRGENRQGVRRPALIRALQVRHWLDRLERTPGPAEEDRVVQAGEIDQEASWPELGVIDLGRYASKGEGAWWSASRGSNAFKSCDALVLIGLPRPNIGAAQAEFSLLDPKPVAPDGEDPFGWWYRQRVGEELIQGINRLRGLRRPDEQLAVYLVCNDDLSGMPFDVEVVDSRTISWWAGGKGWQALAEAVEVIRGGLPAGVKPTQRTVGEAMGPGGLHRLKRALRALQGVASWEQLLGAAEPPRGAAWVRFP
ncbi:hypothetical protein [Synechococcus sp. CCAP 1479/9]|uniref:hypothetical protein n=1 Tax=Synechococcus sp. CCAP 1479/9 TaxID=1221593 RepID=UPI001C2485BA|nr:hypothetical protein [Synechococcus sp. CCAP 1479/9]